MKVLFIHSQPINRDWSTGNTFLNFFDDFPDTYSFHQICLRNGKLEPGFFSSAIFLNDSAVLRSAIDRKPVKPLIYDPLEQFQMEMIPQEAESRVSKAYSYKHSPVLRYVGLLVRYCFWKLGKWKPAVADYVKELKPDVIFYATSGLSYRDDVMHYVHDITDAPVILFHADDHFTFKCYSLNPLFWLNRISSRRGIRRAVKISAYNFCITKLQCDEYAKAMHQPFHLLTKGLSFEEPVSFERIRTSDTLEFVYTGNIFYDRWRTLAYIGKLLDRLQELGCKAELKIYSGNPLSGKIKKAFDAIDSIRFMGSVSNIEVRRIQSETDVLVHVESFGLLQKLKVRQSFSTKIVDYMHAGKCILAAGAGDIAPIAYFSKNDTGLVLTGHEETDLDILKKAFDDNTRKAYAKKAWVYGAEHHDSAIVREKLMKAFASIFEKIPFLER